MPSETYNHPKFKEGTVVYAKANPAQKLVIRRHVNSIYYCKVQQDANHKELVYFESELMGDFAL